MIWLEWMAWFIAISLACPLAVLAIECIAACIAGRPAAVAPPMEHPRTVVLIPAHNEEAGIAGTLESVTRQLGANDQILVVADNCTDRTAEIARVHGATVAERTDAVRRGKGFALSHGRGVLMDDPPQVVIVIDADCTLGDGTISWLATQAAAGRRPVQSANLLNAPPNAGIGRSIAAFAFLVKNVVRPTGLHYLGLPCLLTGTGMAFPWDIFRNVPLEHGHIVEDLNLNVDLARMGVPARFERRALVMGEFPVDEAAASTQRRRWEHGHLSVIFKRAPRLWLLGIARMRCDILAVAAELSVPPLSALVMTTILAAAAIGAVSFLTGNWWPLVMLLAITAVAMFGLALSWLRFGRGTLPLSAVLHIPSYVFRKAGLYLGFVKRPETQWIRTARDGSSADPRG